MAARLFTAMVAAGGRVKVLMVAHRALAGGGPVMGRPDLSV